MRFYGGPHPRCLEYIRWDEKVNRAVRLLRARAGSPPSRPVFHADAQIQGKRAELRRHGKRRQIRRLHIV